MSGLESALKESTTIPVIPCWPVLYKVLVVNLPVPSPRNTSAPTPPILPPAVTRSGIPSLLKSPTAVLQKPPVGPPVTVNGDWKVPSPLPSSTALPVVKSSLLSLLKSATALQPALQLNELAIGAPNVPSPLPGNTVSGLLPATRSVFPSPVKSPRAPGM